MLNYLPEKKQNNIGSAGISKQNFALLEQCVVVHSNSSLGCRGVGDVRGSFGSTCELGLTLEVVCFHTDLN